MYKHVYATQEMLLLNCWTGLKTTTKVYDNPKRYLKNVIKKTK